MINLIFHQLIQLFKMLHVLMELGKMTLLGNALIVLFSLFPVCNVQMNEHAQNAQIYFN